MKIPLAEATPVWQEPSGGLGGECSSCRLPRLGAVPRPGGTGTESFSLRGFTQNGLGARDSCLVACLPQNFAKLLL